MVVSTTKVKQAMGLTPKPKPNPKLKPKPKPITTSVPELLKLVEDLQSRESRLKAELAELNHRNHKSTSLVLALESNLVTKTRQIDTLSTRVADLEVANKELMNERLIMNAEFETKVRDYDVRIVELMNEVEHLNLSSQRYLGLVQVANKSNLIKNLGLNKSALSQSLSLPSSSSSSSENNVVVNSNVDDVVKFDCSNVVELAKDCCSSRVPRVPKPPPKRCFSKSAPAPPPMPITPPGAVMERTRVHPPPPPPPPGKCRAAKVKRVPEVVEFYHSLMRRDSRKENGAGIAEVTMTTAAARDLVGEIENRSAYSLAIKTDVETQGDFIKFLIKEVETAAFTDIEDVVSFVKWLDDELSYLVDERAVLKHFDWPEKKADGLREAAFEYSDLKKLESEASSFRQDTRQACSTTLKKMQTLLEKLEHGVYNLSRLRESATNRFKSFHIPVDWMLDAGFVSQEGVWKILGDKLLNWNVDEMSKCIVTVLINKLKIKLASVKLAMKFMKRVLAELEIVCGGPEEEELIVQGVRFAFRVHQFAGGFDVETMTAFEELRDKARAYHIQGQNQQQQRQACKSMSC